MPDRPLLADPVARAALASLVALVALALYAVSQQAADPTAIAAPLSLIPGHLA